LKRHLFHVFIKLAGARTPSPSQTKNSSSKTLPIAATKTSLFKPSVSAHILDPEETFVIEIVSGAVIEGNESYVPNKAKVLLGISNYVIWENNDETPHTVTPDHRTADSYSGDFASVGVIMPGETFEFLFTEEQKIPYHCDPHPWMTGTIDIEKSRF